MSERGTTDAREARLAPYFAAVGAVAGIAIIARTLAAFTRIVQPYLAVHYSVWIEVGMVVGQVFFQWLVMAKRSWPDRLRYAGLLLGVSGLGALLLWPLLLLDVFAPVTVPTAAGCFFAIVALMFVVHWHFVGSMKLPRILCATWVVYRLLLLAVLVRFPWS